MRPFNKDAIISSAGEEDGHWRRLSGLLRVTFYSDAMAVWYLFSHMPIVISEIVKLQMKSFVYWKSSHCRNFKYVRMISTAIFSSLTLGFMSIWFSIMAALFARPRLYIVSIYRIASSISRSFTSYHISRQIIYDDKIPHFTSHIAQAARVSWWA